MSNKITLDAAIRAAVKEIEADILNDLPAVKETEIMTSDRVWSAVNTRISRKVRRKKAEKVKNSFLRAVSVFAVIFFVCLSPFLTVSAVQDAISQTIIKQYSEYITVETTSEKPPRRIEDIKVGYMTEGFSFNKEDRIGNSITREYVNGKKYIIIDVESESSQSVLGLDSEHSTFFNVEIKNSTGLLMCSEGEYNLIHVAVDGVRYRVSGYAEVNEIIKICSNLEAIC